MSQTDISATSLEILENLLAKGTLSTKAITQGKKLLEQARSPVNIAVLGLPKSGKSQLINLLVGRGIVPSDAPWQSLQLELGEPGGVILTNRDGTTESQPVTDLHSIAEGQIQSAVIQAPDAIFQRVTLFEVALGPAQEPDNPALTDAIRQADIVLFCSQEFSPQERDFWAGVPDERKDHSFFVLTKADILSEQDNLGDTISQIQDAVADEFHSLIPVATLPAIAALQGQGAKNQNALKASGGKVLIEAVMNHVDIGRQADFDSVTLFLNRHGDNRAKIAAIKSELTKTPQAADPTPAPTDSMANALVILREAGDRMMQAPPEGEDLNGFILEECGAASNRLVDLFSEGDFAEDCDPLMQDMVMESADLVLLTQMEDSAEAAADAVTVLLQLRRELHLQLAA